ncbi:glycosyltransferase family 4 protein [Hydrogenimonas sp.]
MKKIRVFLGGYTNSINAQNLNCRVLAQHLDTEKFDIYTLELYSGTLEQIDNENVHCFNCFYPHKISKYIGYLWGIWHCDVAYLPKGEICDWNKFWIKLLRKKSFKTVEGIFADDMIEQILSSGKSYNDFKNLFTGYDRVYSITGFLRDYNKQHHGIETEEKILYLGTDTDTFLNESKEIHTLKNIIFIGRLKRRKGVFDILEVAKTFPELNFFLAGNGEEKDAIESYIEKNDLNNVKLLGTLSHEELATYLKKMDLHLFPSYSEGFPKVTLETAAAGVPSVVYPVYGAKEWIDNNKNGFIVKDVKEIKSLIKSLKEHPETLQEVSKNAIALAKRFDWKIIIREWEKEIEKLYHQ